MIIEIQHTLRKFRGQILGWGIGLAVYSLLMISIYQDISSINFYAVLEYYPHEILRFFGINIFAITTPEGYLDSFFFNSLTVILGIFVVSAGARLLVKDGDDGFSDLNQADPLSRSRTFWGRVAGYYGAILIILGIGWFCWVIPAGYAGINLSLVEFSRPFISLLCQLLLFGSLALLLSLVLPASRIAGMISGGILVANYLLVGLSNINTNLEKIVKLTPLYLYQGGKAVDGLNLGWLLIVFELILLLLLLAWWRFLERDTRVAGDGGWSLNLPKLKVSPTIRIPILRRIRQPLIFLGQRLLFGLLVLAFITYASFLGLDMARGVSFQQAASDGIIKTLLYAADALQGDLGETSSGSVSLLPKPVVEVVPAVIIRSLGLLGVSLLFSAVVGVLLGVFIAGKRSGVTLLALLGSITGVSIPSFFAALLLQLGVIKLTQFYGKALLPVGGFGWDKHLILPMLVLAARPLAQITRVTFVTVEEVLAQDYVRTAFSKGLRSSYITAVHILRNAAVPVLTTIGLSLRFSLSSLPIVEFFFGWQGLGFTLLQSISNQDDYLTIVLALCLGVLFILVNLLLDIAYLLVDPRLRNKETAVSREGRGTLPERWKRFSRTIRAFLEEKPWRKWLGRNRDPEPSPFKELVDNKGEDFSYNTLLELGRDRLRVWRKGTLGNPALIMGVLITITLVGMMLFSPQLSPHSPYTTQGLTIVNGEFFVPPFEPDAVYPWGTDPLGRDIMSLIYAGAQQTFTLAFSVVAVRLLIGFILGALVGWYSGSWLDRVVLGAAETISAFPALLLVTVLILGIGIRQGIRPFVIALSFIGWSEIMQFVRSQVLEIKPKLFIESAAAVGANSIRILQKHVLPNIIPGLISILSLEMGAVLMLLGELGFIGIFIGGGAFAELEIFGPPFHYSDVPEWGALLSNIRIYARSYPWTALYPAGAFFVAISGFNFLGEGIRRLIETVGVAATRVFVNKYTLAAAGVLAAVFFWFRGTTGSTAVFQNQARTFDGQRALAYLEILSDPRWEGRALGGEGMDQAAEYIAGQFQALGIQPAGEKSTFFQTRPRSFESLTRMPSLTLSDTSDQPVYQQDYVEYVSRYRNLGAAKGEVFLLGFGDLMQVGRWWQNFPALDELDFSGQIVMVLSDQDAEIIFDVPKAGVLVVTEDPYLINRRYTLSSRDPFFNPFGSNETLGLDTPMLRISPELANYLLSATDYQLDSLRFRINDLKQDELLVIPTGKTAGMNVRGKISENKEARHVIGYLPGVKGDPRAQLDNQMIVVLAQYDSPPLVSGEPVPGAANDNASGVALMLEMIHTLRESGYRPNKTFLFVAYAGEGLEGGEWVSPDISRFLQTKVGFSGTYIPEAAIDIRGVGGGSGEVVLLSTQGSLRLVELFESSAKRLGIPVKRAEDRIDLSVIFEEGSTFSAANEVPYVGLFWDGWWETGGTAADDLQTIQVESLQQAGETLSLAAMVLGHETDY
jgi:ABC-type dipeptide/oligopeptide/nickel transport system permease component